ncbi:hypothetical protein HZH66_001329 [Vespula vulgaris]|uniref:Uncharacterized protein n=1 Tax=Vespula vulgaris TaxID=7454 RepID=A0A834KT89_VESVU|nr:hypothetical protein HZH66_001329 [Vespula vulgaris]
MRDSRARTRRINTDRQWREERLDRRKSVVERKGVLQRAHEPRELGELRQTTINSRGIVLRVIERDFIRAALTIENVLDINHQVLACPRYGSAPASE